MSVLEHRGPLGGRVITGEQMQDRYVPLEQPGWLPDLDVENASAAELLRHLLGLGPIARLDALDQWQRAAERRGEQRARADLS